MRITIITDQNGQIAGTTRGHSDDVKGTDGIHARLIPGPGQTVHEVDVPEEMTFDFRSSEDVDDFHDKLKAYLPHTKS